MNTLPVKIKALMGYELLTASNGEQAVEIAMCTEPDLILMDLNLPLLDGLAATKRVNLVECWQSLADSHWSSTTIV